MSHQILITGAAGGPQGPTGRAIAGLLLKERIPVRGFVHKLDARSDELAIIRRQQKLSLWDDIDHLALTGGQGVA